jgi:membrane-bound inhibitor of C-type lysozyme
LNKPLLAGAGLMLLSAVAACSNEPSREAPVDGDALTGQAVAAETATAIRTGAEIQQEVMNSVVRAVYLCSNGERLTVDFDNPRAMATVRNSNGLAVDLHQKKAASGIWYTTGGYELRGKGNEATWQASDQAQTTCRATI